MDFQKVVGFDVEHQGRGLREAVGRAEVAFEMLLGDFHAVHLVSHSRLVGGGEGDTEVFLVFARLVGVGDDEGEHRPRTPSEGLDFATLLVFNRLLHGGEVGKVDARAVDALRELLQLHALEGGGGGRLGLEGQFDELPLLVVAGIDEGDGLGVDDGVAHMFFGGWCR